MADTPPDFAEPPLSDRLQGVARNALLALVSLLLAVAAGEAAVRLLAPQQLILKRPDVWRPADTLGWTHRADVSTTINTGEGRVALFTDAEGNRVGSDGRLEADRRILLLGDSFMEALQVEYGESLAGRLERRLAGSVGERVAVRNTGVGGWNPAQYLARARRSLEEQSFDLVLVSLYVGNDVVSERPGPVSPRTPEEVHPFRLPGSLSPDELVDAVLYPINDYLEVRSHLFVLFKRQADQVLMRLGLTAAYFPDVFRETTADSDRWSVTAEICAEIAALARERGVPTLFVLVPASFQVQEETFRRYVAGFDIDPAAVDLDQPNRLLTRELRGRGLAVVDALPRLRRAARTGRPLYGEVDRHLSPRGHGVLARLLEPAVAERLVESPAVTARPPAGGPAADRVAVDAGPGSAAPDTGAAAPAEAATASAAASEEDRADEGSERRALGEDDQRPDEEHDEQRPRQRPDA